MIFDLSKRDGLCLESEYPRVTDRCESDRCKPFAIVTGGVPVPRGDEKALAEAVAKQPVVAAIDVTNAFMSYRDGVFVDQLCSQSKLNHMVLVVGYGTDNQGVEYWIVMNSWGKECCSRPWSDARIGKFLVRFRQGMGNERICANGPQ